VAQLRGSLLRKKVVTLRTQERDAGLTLAGVRALKAEPHRLVLEVDLEQTPVDRVVAQALRTLTLEDLTVEDPPMEEIVKAIYAGARGLGGAGWGAPAAP
jgi:ABC-2 type transport system ATP-binding protein